MEKMVTFWKNKKVFITGHTGFKGSWLSLWLQLWKANVVGFARNPPTPVNLFTEARVAENMVDIRGDVCDYPFLKQMIDEHQPDILFHLAAQPLVRHSYLEPIETYATNVMGSAHVLEAARLCESLRAIVMITSDKCYANKEKQEGYQETEAMGGHDPYSSSKACAELIASAYQHSFFHNEKSAGLATARAGNVIGGGDWASDRLVPDLMSAYFTKQKATIRYPLAVRPWQHVLESLYGYLLLAKKLYECPKKYSGAWNFGPMHTDEKTVQWITEEIARQLEGQLFFETTKQPQWQEMAYLTLNSKKAKDGLGWHPQWMIQKALKQTITWYQHHQEKMDMQKTTLEQISHYIRTSTP